MGAKVTKGKQTPLMKQYGEIKTKYPGAILLFRVGDFYETFGEDAVKAARILDIVLTKRANGSASHIELAGFPHHALDTYLPKLVKAGERVAICDQLEDPKQTKTIVKRGVTELITPGVNVHDKALDSQRNNYLAAWLPNGKNASVAFLDLSTGEFKVMTDDAASVAQMIGSLTPSEVIFPKSKRRSFNTELGSSFYPFPMDDWIFEESFGYERLLRQFETKHLKGFGIEDDSLGIAAAGAVLYYLEATHHEDIGHITGISRIRRQEHLWMDPFTVRNLEVVQPMNDNGTSLFQVVNRSMTPMGSRLLRQRLLLPLIDQSEIETRLELVECALSDQNLMKTVREKLDGLGDLDRLLSKLAMNRISPRELAHLRSVLQVAVDLSKCTCDSPALNSLFGRCSPPDAALNLLSEQLSDDPPANVLKGNVIRSGVNSELDEFRSLQASGKDYLAQMKESEMESTGIPSLKVAFNNVFGYYLEVTNTHKDKVPDHWIRKQTLVNSERYITPELKEYEEKILSAEDRIHEIENRLFDQLVGALQSGMEALQKVSRAIAQLDVTFGLAQLARDSNYCKPQLNGEHKLVIHQGRHPVIEKSLPPSNPFVPNDLLLDKDKQQVMILTGPNMSGKSALLRQTALIALLAQAGSFVPAEQAEIGILDKIYTRVGASDNISQGESTFMVEMTETASILNHVSERSLILLDEIGRGTSTYDGVSLAWSIAEFLNAHTCKPKVIFATHYHELNELENTYEGIVNYHIATREAGKKVVFLRQLKRGGTEHSFGIHVARMAGVPNKVVKRADQILEQLESQRKDINADKKTLKNLKPNDIQMQLFQVSDPKARQLVESLKSLDLNVMTPLEALLKLNELKDGLD
jgi:DNA mismatch repair protein MutS